MPPQDSDEESKDEEDKDKKEEKSEYKDPLDDISPEELEEQKKKFQQRNLKEISDDARALASQFDLQDVLKFHNLREETKQDRELVSSQLKKFFEKKEEEMYRQWIHTKKQT